MVPVYFEAETKIRIGAIFQKNLVGNFLIQKNIFTRKNI